MLNKNITPNLIALLLILLSQLLPEPWNKLLLSVGLFALSGALTNWLAVHMLFERVPGLYGSGVIKLHFEEFKTGILTMVREELFNKESVSRLLANSDQKKTDDKSKPPLINDVDLEPMLKSIDLDAAYDQLVHSKNVWKHSCRRQPNPQVFKRPLAASWVRLQVAITS